MSKEKSTPAPLETEDGAQMDDNVSDLGQKSDDNLLEQPASGLEKKSSDKTKPE